MAWGLKISRSYVCLQVSSKQDLGLSVVWLSFSISLPSFFLTEDQVGVGWQWSTAKGP